MAPQGVSLRAAESVGSMDFSPLIDDRQPLESQDPIKPSPVPLPKVQLLALCAVRLVEPIAFTQIFPWINEFIDDLHITDDPSRVGFYSGIIESAFALAQMLCIYHWARISDKFGRRPVLLISTIGAAFATLSCGLSESFTSMLLLRSLTGLFLGTVAVLHSVLCELSTPATQVRIFPIYGIFWPLGTMIGALIGGSLSHPAMKYPQHFDHSFFRRFPYYLPCFVVGAISLLGLILGYFFLEETLPSKAKTRKEDGISYGTMTDAVVPTSGPSIMQLLASPIIRAICASGLALSFISTSFDVVFVLFCYSPVPSGGIAFSETQIGCSLFIAGAISCFLQVMIMPHLLRTFDSLQIYNFAMGLWPFAFVAMPFTNWLARTGFDEVAGTMDTKTQAAVWVCIAVILLLGRLGWLAYSVSMLLVKENATPTALAATNGLVQLSMCLARSIAPAFVSSSFALSIDVKFLGGHLWVVPMVLLSWRGSLITKNIAKVAREST